MSRISKTSSVMMAVLLSATMLAGCAVGPDYQRPETDTSFQWPWQSQEKKTTTYAPKELDEVSQTWWESFNDPALTALVEEGQKNNADMLRAAANVSQARAMLTSSNADLYPSIDINGNATRTSNSREGRFGGFATNSKPFNDFGVSAVLNYELDLWGRLRRASEGARAELLATEANRDAIQLAVVSDIAMGYFNLRALDAQIDVTRQTIQSRQSAYNYQKKQFDLGSVNTLTFKQAEAELASAQASLPTLEQARVEQENALAVLLGRSPKEIVTGKIATGKSVDALPSSPMVPVNMPSTLLERRPDIMAAEQNLVAANADIGVAKADYFPRLSLGALIGLSASETDRVFRASARRWQTGATLAMPLVDFGKTRAGVESAEARKEIALADYQQTIRSSFAEVLNAISAEKTSTAREAAQSRQARSLAESVRLSELRYKSGYSNYLEVLDAQRQLYTAQLARITAKRDRLTSAVNLYKSLGGGWAPKQAK